MCTAARQHCTVHGHMGYTGAGKARMPQDEAVSTERNCSAPQFGAACLCLRMFTQLTWIVRSKTNAPPHTRMHLYRRTRTHAYTHVYTCAHTYRQTRARAHTIGSTRAFARTEPKPFEYLSGLHQSLGRMIVCRFGVIAAFAQWDQTCRVFPGCRCHGCTATCQDKMSMQSMDAVACAFTFDKKEKLRGAHQNRMPGARRRANSHQVAMALSHGRSGCWTATTSNRTRPAAPRHTWRVSG